MVIPEDLLQQIDEKRKEVHMDRSQFICENLKHGEVVQLSLPEEDRNLLNKVSQELDEIRDNDQELHLILLLTDQLTPQMETDYHGRTNELTRIRKELEALQGRRKAA